MSWKVRLLLVFMVACAAAIWMKLPSQATKGTPPAPNGDKTSVTRGKITQYNDGIYKVEPEAFAISPAVRDLPTTEPDALQRSTFHITKGQLRQAKAEIEAKEKGITVEQYEEEINKLNARDIKKLKPGAGAGDGPFEDPLVKRDADPNAPQVMPTPDLTFDGATSADNASQGIGGLTPPDTNGDVGPNHYVSSVNLVLKIFNKNGTVATGGGPFRMSQLFSSLPAGSPCRRDDGDPIVLYDQLADRWHISQFGLPNGLQTPTFQCIAVSVTGDPTGQYYVWSYQYPVNKFNDYPKVGVWSDGYHMTFNQFTPGGTAFAGLGILTQDRNKALVGDPTTSIVFKDVAPIDPEAGGALPADIEGFVAPPAGLAEVIMEFRADEFGDPVDGLRVYKWVPDFTTPANSTLTVLTPDVTLAAFDARQPAGRTDIEQSGGSNLDAIPDRVLHRLVYRNLGSLASPTNSYVGNFVVNTSGSNPTSAALYDAGIRWFELRRAADVFSVFDQGTQADTAGTAGTRLNNWMGSISQDNQGNLALGYSQSGPAQNADIKIAGRTNNVMNSGTLNEGEALFFDALGSQTGSNRWGDYSMMSVDPVDDCTFWYTQEYYATSSATGWATRVGKFKFPSCNPAPKGTITGTITFCDGGAPITGALVGATGGAARVTIANGTYSMTVAPGTYSVSASKSGGFNTATQNGVVVTNGGTTTVNLCLTGVPVITNPTPAAIVAESCGTPNNAPDPGENLTVSLSLQNNGAASTANLTATLQATGGVTNPGPGQNYGALAPGGAAVSRNHTFTVNPAAVCGSTITLTWNLTDGATNLGTVTRTFSTGTPIVNLTQNFDSVTPPALPTGWTSVQTSGTGITWTTVNTTPSSAPNAAFANDPATVNGAALVTPPVNVQSVNAQLSFKNWFDTEASATPTVGFDGMVLEYTTNGGTTWTDVITGGGTFVSGGYNRTISAGFMSPIAGRMAWSGVSGGGASAAYIDTVVNLPASLNGQTVQFRWLMATDSSVADAGVRVDNVQVTAGVQCNTCGGPICRIQRRDDYDGDGKTDFSVWRSSNTTWFVQPNGSSNFYGVVFGAAGDKLQPADYEGDGKTDMAVFRNGVWWWLESSTGIAKSAAWGLASDVPVIGDYTGDGKADLAVYRNGVWWVRRSEDNSVLGVQWGGDPTDVPIIGDFDNDCKTDFAVRRTTNQPDAGATDYFVLQSTAGFNQLRFGRNDQLPAVGDYDGDGKSELGVAWLVGGNYLWYSLEVGSPVYVINGVQHGTTGDIPVPADFDGDGKADLAVWRPSDGTFYYLRSGSGNSAASQAFGVSTDTPTGRWYQQPLP